MDDRGLRGLRRHLRLHEAVREAREGRARRAPSRSRTRSRPASADLLSVAYANGGSLSSSAATRCSCCSRRRPRGARLPRGGVDAAARSARSAGSRCRGSHVQLRMSVGVHTGTSTSSSSASPIASCVVTGPGWTATSGWRHIAEAGEILVSARVAAAMPGALPRRSRRAGLLLLREPPGDRRRRGVPTPSVAAASRRTACRPRCATHVLAGGGDARAPAGHHRVHPLRRRPTA